MKKLVAFYMVKFLVVGLLLPVAPAMAQRESKPPSFNSLFGRQQAGQNTTDVPPATAGSSVLKEDEDDPLDLTFLEIAKVFTENEFAISQEGDIRNYVARVSVFSRERLPKVGGSGYYRYYYHREPESVVFVSLENADGDTKIIGSGENKNLQKAAQEAAKNAAKKLKKKLGDAKPVILLRIP